MNTQATKNAWNICTKHAASANTPNTTTKAMRQSQHATNAARAGRTMSGGPAETMRAEPMPAGGQCRRASSAYENCMNARFLNVRVSLTL